MKRICSRQIGLILTALAGTAVLSVVSAVVGGAAQAGDPALPTHRSFAQPALLDAASQRNAPPVAETPNAAAVLRPSQTDGADASATAPSGLHQSRPLAGHAHAVPVKPAQEHPQWPRLVPTAHSEADAAAETYAPADVVAGRARCAQLLRGLDVVVVDEAPIKAGTCGTPAPVQLISIGRNPQVALSPPLTMTCDMVAALHQWVTKEIQPLARKHLSSPLASIETMSSYSCRNAYGRKRGNLSEHGRANAIDIRAFHTTEAKEVAVLQDWGPTSWEIRAQVAAEAKTTAAAKLAADKAAAAKAAHSAAAKSPATTAALPEAPAAQQSGTGGATSSIGKLIEGAPSIANRLPGAAATAEGRSGFGLIKPSQLGGPRVPAEKGRVVTSSTAAVTAPDMVVAARRSQFLREAHASACRIFGTTLGPETNLAHKNHFHLDMAERASGKNYCE